MLDEEQAPIPFRARCFENCAFYLLQQYNFISHTVFNFWGVVFCSALEFIHLLRTQSFPKNQHFLPPDMHTFMSIR